MYVKQKVNGDTVTAPIPANPQLVIPRLVKYGLREVPEYGPSLASKHASLLVIICINILQSMC